MNRTENQKRWDAKRLIREYVKLGKIIKYYKDKPFDDIIWSNQIRIKRIASVLRAFMELKGVEEQPLQLINSAFDGRDYSILLDNSSISEDDHARLMTLAKKAINDDLQYNSIMHMYETRAGFHEQEQRPLLFFRNRIQMLSFFFEFRLATEELMSHFDGVLEASPGGILGYYAIKGLYFPDLKVKNDMMDEMIVILLGDKFKKSFSEQELKTEYGYPLETDSELLDWECDNW